MIKPPPRDPALPGLPTLLDAAAMRELLMHALPDCRAGLVELASATPTYVRYKPGTSCLVGYDLELVDPETGATTRLPAHVRVHAAGGAGLIWRRRSMQRLVQRSARRHGHPLSIRAALLEDPPGLVQVFPVDRALVQVVRAADRSSAGRLLARIAPVVTEKVKVRSIELIRYRPARKALLRYRLGGEVARLLGRDWYVKAYADDRATRIGHLTGRLREAGIPLPPPLGVAAEERLFVQAAAQGEPLHELRDEPSYVAAMPGVAELLHRLHRLPVEEFEALLVEGESSARLLARSAATLAALLPEHERRIRRLAEQLAGELAALGRAPSRPIHGDFYDDQLLVAEGELVMLDLDEARLGNPATDAGNMLGYISAKLRDEAAAGAARDRFLVSWSGRRPGQVAREALLHEAVALVLMAIGPFRRLESDWPQAILRHIELADERLADYRAKPIVGHSLAAAHADQGNLPPNEKQPALAPELPVEAILPRLSLPQPARLLRRRLVRDKPGRRWTACWELEVGAQRRRRIVYAKQYASNRAVRVASTIAALGSRIDGATGPRLPTLVGCLPEAHLVVVGEVTGSGCTERLVDGDAELARSIAEAISLLHASGAQLPRRRELADEISVAGERGAALARAGRTLAPRVGRALDELHRAVARRSWRWRYRPLHRDFYPDQVLLDGAHIGFIDLDDAAMGEPALDIANFAAHLRLLALRRPDRAPRMAIVEAAFVERAGELDPDLDQGLLAVLHAATCLRLAHIHLERVDGRHIARALIEETITCLSNAAAA